MKRKSSLPLLVGRKPVLEALQEGTPLEKIFLLRSASGDEIMLIRQLAKQRHIPLSLVPQEKLDGLTKSRHQGVVAWGGLINYTDFQEALSFVVEQGQTPLFVLLDGVTDVRNTGAIARTALCCGAQGLILPVSSSASLTEEAIKTSAGALQKILLCRVPSVEQAIDILRLNGIQVLGTSLQASVPVYEANFNLPTCIVMGSEDKGISKDVIRRADQLIHIPMMQDFDSLNVSVATGMILYEAVRQRISSVQR